MDSHTLVQALIYLGSAALIVPIAVRLGLGSVLGYLIAGCIIGPWGLRLVTDAESILHFAEIGVVLMLALDVVVGVFWEEIFPDPRTMSGQARAMQSILFFGFWLYLILRLMFNCKKLRNPDKLEADSRRQQDERRLLVGEKAAKLSGDLTLVGLTLAVFVTSLYNMDMFNALYYTLLGCVLLRAGSWFYYSRKY